MSYYGMGDYYQVGDYYRGDFLGLGKLAKGAFRAVGKAAGVIGSVIPGPVGGAAKLLGKVAGGGGGRSLTMRTIPPPIPYSYPPPIAQQTIIRPVPGIRGKVQRFVPGGASGYEQAPPGYHFSGGGLVRNRRMNVANVRALRRAIRRAKGFEKLARRVGSFTRPGTTYRLKGRAAKRRR